MIKTKNQKQNSFSNAKNSSCQMFSQISLNQSVAVIIYMFFLFSYNFEWNWEEREAPIVLTRWIPDFSAFSLFDFF